MSDYMTVVMEKKNDKGIYEYEGGFEVLSSYVYGWLSGHKGRSMIGPVAPNRGFPDDLNNLTKNEVNCDGFDSFGHSWASMDELLAIDYDQIVEDRRCQSDGRLGIGGFHTCPEGQGRKMPLREFLGEEFMNHIRDSRDEKIDRWVFWFV